MSVLHLTLPPATTPLERFVRILDGPCAAVAARGAGGVLTAPLLLLLWGRLRRMAVRATRAAARLAAGVQPAVRPRPATPRPPRPPRPQKLRLLADPAMVLLAATPSMRRLLNPLCQMLGVPAWGSHLPRRPAAVPAQPAAMDRAAADHASDARPRRPSRRLPPEHTALVAPIRFLHQNNRPAPSGEPAASLRHGRDPGRIARPAGCSGRVGSQAVIGREDVACVTPVESETGEIRVVPWLPRLSLGEPSRHRRLGLR